MGLWVWLGAGSVGAWSLEIDLTVFYQSSMIKSLDVQLLFLTHLRISPWRYRIDTHDRSIEKALCGSVGWSLREHVELIQDLNIFKAPRRWCRMAYKAIFVCRQLREEEVNFYNQDFCFSFLKSQIIRDKQLGESGSKLNGVSYSFW